MSYRVGASSSVILSLGGGAVEPRLGLATGSGLDFKLQVLSALVTVSILFGLGPLRIIRACSRRPEACRQLIALFSCFAGGVFFATCLLDLLPDFLTQIHRAFNTAGITLRFPLPEFIVSMGFLVVLVLEQVVLALRDQSRSSWSGEERRSLLEDSGTDTTPLEVGPAYSDSRSQAGLRALVLVSSLSLHALFEGVAIGQQEVDVAIGPQQEESAAPVGVALLVPKSILSFSLAISLARSRLRAPALVLCLLLFALAPVVGVALGVLLPEVGWNPRYRLIRCTLGGLATGTLIYVTMMEVLPRELGSGRLRLPRVTMMLLGFAAVTGALFVRI